MVVKLICFLLYKRLLMSYIPFCLQSYSIYSYGLNLESQSVSCTKIIMNYMEIMEILH